MELTFDHHHEEPETKPAKKESPKQSTKKTLSTKKIEQAPLPPQQPIFKPPQFYQQSSSHCFYLDGLEQIRSESSHQLQQAVIEAILNRKRFSEERVFEAIVNTNLDFVSIHFKDFGFGIKNELNKMFEDIHNEVEAGIWDGQYDVNKKNNYFQHKNKEQQLVTYITEELVRKNINNFKMELDQSLAESEYLDGTVPPNAQSQIDKARKAEQFVKKIQEEQMKYHSFINKKKEEEKQLEVRSMQERQSKEEETRKQKHDMVLKRIEKKQQMRSIESQHKKKIQSEYLRFISSARKPLHQQMQQRYEKQRMEEQRVKYRKMKKMMQEKKPLSFNEINQHMDKYEELLYEHQQYRKEKALLKEHQMQIIASKKPYRSKFYSLAAKGSPRVDEKELRTSLVRKQTTFAEHVKKNFMPKADQKKHQEIQELIRKVNSHKNKAQNSRKYIEQGNRNLEKLHLLIGQMRAKNKIKQTISLESIVEPTPPRRYKNYLEDVRHSRIIKDIASMSVDYASKLEKQDHQMIRIEAMKKETKAKQQDLYLDSAIETLDFDSHMSGKKKVEHDFIESAKAKMAIIKKFQTQGDSATIQ